MKYAASHRAAAPAALACCLAVFLGCEGSSEHESNGEQGLLFGFDGVLMNDVIDPDSGQYRLYPLAPPTTDGVRVTTDFTYAIIDSGVRSDHPQLKGIILEETDFTGEGVADELGHGTYVALISAWEGYKRGRPVCGHLIAKVARRNGTVAKQDVLKAIAWAVGKGARIVNLSLGFVGSGSEYRDLCELIRRWDEVAFVVAAGNRGPSISVYPAACDAANILSVGTRRWSLSGKAKVVGDPPPRMVSPENHNFEATSALEAGVAAFRANEITLARHELERALLLAETPQVLIQLAYVDLSEGMLDAAEGRLTRTRELAGSDAGALFGVGIAWIEKMIRTASKADAVKAREALDTTIKLDEFHVGAQIALAVLDLLEDRPGSAQEHLTRAHELAGPALSSWWDPLRDELLHNLGNAWLMRGEPAKAREAFEAKHALNPLDSRALIDLALVDLQEDLLDAAKGRLIRASELARADPELLHYLAIAWLAWDTRADEEGTAGLVKAKEALEASLALRPRNAAVLHDLAMVYVRMGELRKGLETFRRTREIAPDFAEIDERIREVEGFLSNQRDGS